MITKERIAKAREIWIECYKQLGSVSKAARKCGIPRSTLYRWIKRVKAEGEEGLKGHSKRPKRLAKQKVTQEFIDLIKSIRLNLTSAPQRICIHLLRMHNLAISAPTIWRVLWNNNMPRIKKYRKHNDIIRYNRPIPGDRVQIDVTKIGPKCYQFTAIDDCTRLRVLRLYPNKKSISAGNFWVTC
jgi:transposase